MVLRISPKMSIEPGKLLGRHPAQLGAKDVLVGVHHGKLRHEQFGLTRGVFAVH